MFLNGAGALGTSGKDFDWWVIKIAELRSPSVNMTDTWIRAQLVGYGIDATNIELLMGTAYGGSPAVLDSIRKYVAGGGADFSQQQIQAASSVVQQYVAPQQNAQTKYAAPQQSALIQYAAPQQTVQTQTYDQYAATQNYVAPGSASSGAVVGPGHPSQATQPAAQKSGAGILALLAAGLAAINLF